MPRLGARLDKLEQSLAPPSIRPCVIVDENEDPTDKLAAWQERYGPCNADPLIIRLVGMSAQA